MHVFSSFTAFLLKTRHIVYLGVYWVSVSTISPWAFNSAFLSFALCNVFVELKGQAHSYTMCMYFKNFMCSAFKVHCIFMPVTVPHSYWTKSFVFTIPLSVIIVSLCYQSPVQRTCCSCTCLVRTRKGLTTLWLIENQKGTNGIAFVQR